MYLWRHSGGGTSTEMGDFSVCVLRLFISFFKEIKILPDYRILISLKKEMCVS